jgi:hypothetical protein
MITRRRLLSGAIGVTGAAFLNGLGTAGPAHSTPAQGPASGTTGNKSANGWAMSSEAIAAFTVAGTGKSVSLHSAVAPVLLYVAGRWHYEVLPLTEGTRTVIGHSTGRSPEVDFESNHLSGTAIALHPDAFPLGVGGGLWSRQEVVVRDILADCEGVVRWGGDLDPVKQSHFHIDVPPSSQELVRVTEKFRAWELKPGHGPGVVTDPADPARQARARRLKRVQSRS